MMRRPNAFELTPEQALLYENIWNQPFLKLEQGTLDQPVFFQNLIVNALAHSWKCLILSPNIKITDQLMEALQAQNLSNFAHILEEHLNDDFFKRPEHLEQQRKNKKTFNAQEFDFNFAHLLRLHLQLRKQYLTLRTPVFADLNWPDLVGLFLQRQTELGNETLNPVLSQDGFSFTVEEYNSLLEALQQGQTLYEGVLRQDHPLKALHAQIFLQKKLQEAQTFVVLKLTAYQQRTNSLIQKFQQNRSAYGQLLREHLEQKIKFFLNKLDQILDQIEEKVKKYGQKYLEAKTGKISWFPHLSGQGKSQIQDYRQIKAAYETLQRDFEQTQWFAFKWPNSAKLTTLKAIKTTLESFENALKLWQVDLWRFIQEEELRLNAKFALPELAQQERIVALEEEMEELIGDLNETQLLDAKVEHNMLTLVKRTQYLSQIQQQLEDLSTHLKDFPAFYKWQGFWLNQGKLEKELMRKLIEAKAKDWSISFENWYWRQVLYRSRQKDLPDEGSQHLHSYLQGWRRYKQMLPDQMLRLQANDHSRKIAIKHIKTLKKQPAPIQIKSWQDLAWINRLYPILMLNECNPTDFADKEVREIFDLVVVLDPPNNDDQLEFYRNLGKSVVVFEQKPTQEEEKTSETPQISGLKEAAQEGFWSSFVKAILPYFGTQRIARSVQVEGLLLSLVLKPEQEGKPGFVFLQDGFLSTLDATDFAWEAAQQQRLREAGWELVYVWSEECWKNLHETCRRIAAEIISKEKKTHLG